jgi:hypothetical protein
MNYNGQSMSDYSAYRPSAKKDGAKYFLGGAKAAEVALFQRRELFQVYQLNSNVLSS